ncbi:hypothetical protein HMSSN139_24100 [Paenibacillus sp. HMSSN-139]|nr:hypothetical protein HMSSN139_24100 [Paenibacillus sp. HMSSN-139]
MAAKPSQAEEKDIATDKKTAALEEVNRLVARAKAAQEKFLQMNQEQVDRAVQAMALAGLDKHMLLAKMAVEETGRGVL